MISEPLLLWMDPVRRAGPEAMAVDEWLLESAALPVLRVYGWHGDWGTLGYFGKLADAKAAVAGVQWVRRWSGGGVVDHRADWTYSLVLPRGGALAEGRGAESYRLIHLALGAALREEGLAVHLSAGTEPSRAALCFENPVSHDLIDGAGNKLAGAGQRRTRLGMLHQGSVAAVCAEAESRNRAERLASGLAVGWENHEFQVPEARLSCLVRERYGQRAWTERR